MMKNKLIACFLCIVLTFSLFSGVVSAKKPVGEAEDLIGGILAYKMQDAGVDSVQAWLDGALCAGAGGVEWYTLALAQSGEEYDFSAYLDALRAYVTHNNVASATTRQKYALVFLACGEKNEFTEETAKDSVGKLGIMSFIFGLQMAANGLLSEENTEASILDMLLSRQLSDGGFALTGEHADADVTAMAVQALAHYRDQENVQTALFDAVNCLSSLMREDGNYTNYGVINAESTAQVIIALSTLHIDIFSDARFIKNDKTLLDTLLDFRLENGSFSHTLGGETNENATSQALCALIALRREHAGNPPFYDLDQAENAVFSSLVIETGGEKTLDYRVIVTLIFIILALIVCLVFFFTGKRHPKNFLAVLIVLAAAVCFVFLIKIESAKDYYGGETAKGEIVGTVTMTIRCDTVAGKEEHIPADGVILPVTSFDIDADDTVYDILTEAARAYEIHIDKKGAQGLVYVSGIGYLYEFDYGDLSGWIYEVNGERADVGCDGYLLSDGDEIVWAYTLTLGKDFS